VNIATHPVVASLTPVFLLIGAGYVAGRRQWVRGEAVKDLSNLVFLLLIPALLFRTMSSVRLETLDLTPMAAYFTAALGLLLASLLWRGFNCRSVVLGLGGVFSNMVMIGITLVGLAYGQAGLVTLLTVVSVNALILLTIGSVVLELAQARDLGAQGGEPPHVLATAWSAVKGAVIHPVPLPIVCGLLFAQTGWALPAVVDKPLQLLGNAFGPVSLLLVGVSLARTPLAGQWAMALQVTLAKNVVLPVLVGLSAWAFGLRGLPLTVLVVAAGLPMGANVFLFAQRYNVVQEETTAAMGVSTVLAIVTLSVLMVLMAPAGLGG
jgi:malonate transporter and related proteins